MDTSIIRMILSNLLTQIPVIAVCVIAIPMLATHRVAAPGAVAWAMGGFALTAGLSFLMPLISGLIMMLQMNGTLPSGSLTWAYSVFGVFSSLLHAASYGLLLMALLKLLRPASPRRE